MIDVILDNTGSENVEIRKEENLNYRRILSVLWASFAIGSIAVGFEFFHTLYNIGDRTTGLLALIDMYIPEVEFAYQFVIQGVLSFGVALAILFNHRNRKKILIVYLGILATFYLSIICYLYVPPPLFSLGSLCCIFLSFISLLRHKDSWFPLSALNVKMEYSVFFSIGVLPFFMERIIDYKIIHFWDLKWLSFF